MSSLPASTSHLICPSCDAEPPPEAQVSLQCPACGARLVHVRAVEDEMVGKVVDDRFEIRDRLGEGGMGTVYRAWQRSIGREIALKLIDRRFVRDVMAVRRFLREARLASQLSQPNTVSIFDFGQCEDGRLFIAMELIRGRTLDTVMAQDGKLSVDRAVRIGVQLCDALEAAHSLQIVHRDLKLANVMLLDDPPGRDLIKVLDFGLAKSLVDDETHRTQSGVVVGTPRYMAPEIAAGVPASASADLYAVGVMLGELTTGRTLWEATSLAALIGQKMSPSAVIDEVPAPLRALIARLIDPEPSRRHASATFLRSALQKAASGVLPAAPTEVQPGRPTVNERPAQRAPEAAAPTIALRASPPITQVPTPPPEPRSKLPMLALALAGIVAVAIVIVIATKGGGSAPAAAPAVVDARPRAAAVVHDAAPVPVAAIDAGVAATVTLHVDSKPTGATIRVDGTLVGETPKDLVVPRGDISLDIVLQLGGKVAKRPTVPDRDRQVDAVFIPNKHKPKDGTPF